MGEGTKGTLVFIVIVGTLILCLARACHFGGL